MNPIMQLLGQKSSSGIFDIINMIKSAGNPQQMLQSMVNSNPQIQQVMNYINQNGGDPKSAFYKLANEKGIDPDSILNQLK